MMRKNRKESTAKLNQSGLTKRLLRLRVNGEIKEVGTETSKTLLEVLREDLGLTGTKHGCELGECGTCTVLMNNEPVLSCLVLGVESEESDIVTVEGLARNGKPHPLQQAFADLGATQCGYCIPGMLLTAKALLDKHPHPAREQIREALAGNLCRCTGYTKILDAVELVVKGEVA
jgi:carbon-monoxide dehydrogenase small subunit